jgi:hypothetical protein
MQGNTMFGIIGTIAVVGQMALLSTGFDIKLTLTVSLIACVAWICHALKQKDNSLLATNIIVAGFAVFGLGN